MSGSLIPNGKQQYLDANGAPLAGGKVYYYIPYTTTAKNTWQDINLTILNTNPIILDSAGECIAWGSGAYRQQIYDVNDNLIWDQYTYGISPAGSNFISQEEVQTATQGQTVFTLSTITYVPGINSLVVFVNGSKQVTGTNYTEMAGNTVTFVTGLNAGDVVDFYASLPATAQNMSNAVTVAYVPPFSASATTNVQAKLSQYVSVKDFGATGNGTTDDTSSFQNAVNYATTYNRTIFVPTGTYKLTSQITKASSSNGLNIVGENAIGTILNYSTLSANTSLFVIVGVEANANAVISDLTFTGNTTSTAIEIQQQNFQLVQRCIFNTNEIGITLTNTTGYTEYCVATDCIFQGCYQALFYNNTTTTFTSFHGSGLNHCQISEVSGSTLSPIQIGGSTVANNNFVVYNAVLDFQCWKYNTSTPIIQNNSTSNIINFHGTLTVENFTGSNVTLGGGSRIWYAGHYTSNSNYAYPGTLFFVYDIYSNSSGTPYATLKPFKIPNKVLAAGANNIYDFGYVPGVGSPQSFLTTITFTSSADAWELSYLLIIYTGTGGFNSSVTTLAQLANYFGGLHAAPTFVMVGDVLIATGVGWPAATISCVGVVQSHANLGDLLL